MARGKLPILRIRVPSWMKDLTLSLDRLDRALVGIVCPQGVIAKQVTAALTIASPYISRNIPGYCANLVLRANWHLKGKHYVATIIRKPKSQTESHQQNRKVPLQ